MLRVRLADTNQALEYLEAGRTVGRVSMHVGVHHSTIHRLI